MKFHAEDDDNYSEKLVSRAGRVFLELADWMLPAGVASASLVLTHCSPRDLERERLASSCRCIKSAIRPRRRDFPRQTMLSCPGSR